MHEFYKELKIELDSKKVFVNMAAIPKCTIKSHEKSIAF